MTCGIVLASLLLTAVTSASVSASAASASRVGKPSWRHSGTRRSSGCNIVGRELYSGSIVTTAATTTSSSHPFSIGSSLCGRRRGIPADRRSSRTSDENCYFDPAAETCLLFLKDEHHRASNCYDNHDIRTIQPCRSIGNTLARGALLRIASDLSVRCRCLLALSACNVCNALLLTLCVLCVSSITGRNSTGKHQNTR